MLKYIYGQDPFQGRGEGPAIHYHFNLFAVAGKYQVDSLLGVAAEKAKEKLALQWEDACFSSLLHTIYVETPTHSGELREGAKEICQKHIKKLMKERQEFRELLLEVPELAFDIVDIMSK